MAHGVLNVLVAEVEVNRARVLAGIRQKEAGGVAQNVGMDRKVNAGRLRGLRPRDARSAASLRRYAAT